MRGRCEDGGAYQKFITDLRSGHAIGSDRGVEGVKGVKKANGLIEFCNGCLTRQLWSGNGFFLFRRRCQQLHKFK
jgi:hypothetical protein